MPGKKMCRAVRGNAPFSSTRLAIFQSLESRTLLSTVNVSSFGAVVNDATDDTAAIQSAIAAAGSGGTVQFGPGRYVINGKIQLASNQTYTGNGAAVLAKTGDFAAELDNGSNVTIDGLVFDGSGLAVGGTTPTSNLLVRNSIFQNITNAWASNNGIFVASGLNGSQIVSNRFTNINGDTGIYAYNIGTTSITDNLFDTVNEGIHLIFGNPTAGTGVVVARNVGQRIHRIGIEIQGSGSGSAPATQGLLVQANQFRNFLNPAVGTYGLSVVVDSGVDTQIFGNILDGNAGTDWGIEVTGNNTDVSGNVINGFSSNIAVDSAAATVAIHDNTLTGWTSSSFGSVRILYAAATVTMTNNVSDSAPHDIGALFTTFSSPSAPTSLLARLNGSSQAVLSWTDNATDESGYQIERSTDGVTYKVVGALAPVATGFTDSGLLGGLKCTYRVRACNLTGNSAYSNTSAVTTPGESTVPNAPTNLAATTSTNGNKINVNLTWKDNSSIETGYNVERQIGSGIFQVIARLRPNTTAYSDPRLSLGTYSYRVQAVGKTASSAYSNTVTLALLAFKGAVTGTGGASSATSASTDSASSVLLVDRTVSDSKVI